MKNEKDKICLNFSKINVVICFAKIDTKFLSH